MKNININFAITDDLDWLAKVTGHIWNFEVLERKNCQAGFTDAGVINDLKPLQDVPELIFIKKL